MVKKPLSPMKFYLQFLMEVDIEVFLACALQENVDSLAPSLNILSLILLPKEHPEQSVLL